MKRNISTEYREIRVKGSPYLICNGNFNPIGTYSLLGSDNLCIETQNIEEGSRDLLLTKKNATYLISDNDSESGISNIPERLILNRNYSDNSRVLDIYRQAISGRISFSHFKNGQYGSVGFNPEVRGIIYDNFCIKYFNLAYPLTDKKWKECVTLRKNKKTRNGEWFLSAVTGVGAYIASRIIRSAELPSPEVYLGTNDLLIQERIEGYTVSEIFDMVETGDLTEVIGEVIGDWFSDNNREIATQVRDVFENFNIPQWMPDFNIYDVVMGNLMIRREGLHDPQNNYVIIDPLA